jgi:CBS-domain-containing membrane protein
VKKLLPLPVYLRVTIGADGNVRKERLAQCPASNCWVSLHRCKACADCAHVSGDSKPILICSVAPSRRSRKSDGTVQARLAPAVWCIDAGAPATLVDRMPATQAEAVVVDRDGHAIGLLGREGAAAPLDARASDVMDPMVISLLDGAPIDQASELLRDGRVRTIAVMAGGKVVGCVNAESVDKKAGA